MRIALNLLYLLPGVVGGRALETFGAEQRVVDGERLLQIGRDPDAGAVVSGGDFIGEGSQRAVAAFAGAVVLRGVGG